MKKITLSLFILLSAITFSQEPFSYDTIRVSRNDSRNIHQFKNRQRAATHNQAHAKRQRFRSIINNGFDARKMRYGLNFGLDLRRDYTLLRFAPQVGYQVNRYLMAGVGVSYYHSKRKLYSYEEKLSRINNSLGANAFAYLYPARMLVVSARPELNYIWSSYKGDMSGEYNKRNVLAPSFVVGAGLRLGPAHAMLYYDLGQHADSPYSSGIFYGLSIYF